MNRPTIKDVARRAGVHHSTVSLALKDSPRIPEATRQRIRQVVQALGYRPDRVSMALTARRGRGGLPLAPRIVFVSSFRDREAFDQMAYNRLFWQGSLTRASELGYTVELHFLNPQSTPDKGILHLLRSGFYEGAILGALDPLPHVTEIDWGHHPVVKIDSLSIAPGLHTVCNDQVHAARLGYRRLRALGYRRIGMAVGRTDEENMENQYSSGYHLEAAALGAEVLPILHFGYDTRAPDVTPLVGSWIRRHAIEAVMSNWHYIIPIVRDAGFLVPNEVACAGLGLGEPQAGEAGVVQDFNQVGSKAVDLLVSSLKAGAIGADQDACLTKVAGWWQDGASAPGR